MSAASDQITEYLSVGGLFNPEMMNQTQHEAVRDTLIKARDDIQRLERYNAALREQVEELDAKWKMAEDQCFDQVGKIGELERENAALRRDVYQCPPTSENSYEGFKWNDACEELEQENAALRADKERLDWLDHNAIPWTWMSPEKIDGLGPIVVTWKSNRTLRAAIDAARKEAQP